MFDLAPPPNEKQMTNAIEVKSGRFESQAAFARHMGVSAALITKQKTKLTFEEIYEKYKTAENLIEKK